MSVRTLYLVDGRNVLGTDSWLTFTATVFNNKTFAMFQVPSASEGYVRTHQRDPIYCGENIELFR